IAAPDPAAARLVRDTRRERPENNPMSYFERVRMITNVLVEARVSRADFGFVPFPIETPGRLPNFIPTSIPCLTTVYDEWNRQKITQLTEVGYRVVVLYERTVKEISGTAIRTDLIEGGNAWSSLVPPATARAIQDLGIAERLGRLSAAE